MLLGEAWEFGLPVCEDRGVCMCVCTGALGILRGEAVCLRPRVADVSHAGGSRRGGQPLGEAGSHQQRTRAGRRQRLCRQTASAPALAAPPPSSVVLGSYFSVFPPVTRASQGAFLVGLMS